MALKIRQKKQPKAPTHASYSGNTGKHWAEQYKEDNQQKVRKSFIAIVLVMIAIVVVLIASAITTVIMPSQDISQITAADTFAVSTYEQEQMSEDAQDFATGVLVYAYCSDDTTANEGKIAALSLMTPDTDSYAQIETLERIYPEVSPQNFVPIITTPTMKNPTTAYAADFVYEFDGAVADAGLVNESNPDGTIIDKGYHFKLSFSYAADPETGDGRWVISNVEINSK